MGKLEKYTLDYLTETFELRERLKLLRLLRIEQNGFHMAPLCWFSCRPLASCWHLPGIQ